MLSRSPERGNRDGPVEPFDRIPSHLSRAGHSVSPLEPPDNSTRRSRRSKLRRRSGRHSRALSSLALVFRQSGNDWRRARCTANWWTAPRAYVPADYLALTAEASGQHEEAMSLARRAWDAREPTFILHARHFPEFRSLRSDPRFVAILREMNRPTTGEASIAVLPFANMSADKENDSFGDGLAEEIINVLAQVPGLKVAGRTSSFFSAGCRIRRDRQAAQRRAHSRGERTCGGQPHPSHGAADQGRRRFSPLVGLVRPRDDGHLRDPHEITHSIAAALRIRLSRETTTARRHVPNLRRLRGVPQGSRTLA